MLLFFMFADSSPPIDRQTRAYKSPRAAPMRQYCTACSREKNKRACAQSGGSRIPHPPPFYRSTIFFSPPPLAFRPQICLANKHPRAKAAPYNSSLTRCSTGTAPYPKANLPTAPFLLRSFSSA